MLTRLYGRGRHALACYSHALPSLQFATFSTTTNDLDSASTDTTAAGGDGDTTNDFGGSSKMDTTASTNSPSPAPETWHESYEHLGDFVTGTVKFYDKNKLYGFVKPHEAPKEEIYFHRIDFVTPLNFEEFPKAPTLFGGDKIRFRVQQMPEGTNRAREIMLQNGKPIPPLRRSWLKYRIRSSYSEMGDSIFTALENPDLTQDQQWQVVQQAYTYCQERQAGFHQIIESVGMKVEDFDVEKDDGNAPKETSGGTTTTYTSVEQMKQDILSDDHEDGATK